MKTEKQDRAAMVCGWCCLGMAACVTLAALVQLVF